MMQPGLDNYTDIGRYLRDSRESLNLHLEDVAHALNIRYRYLLAIEEGKFSTVW